MAESRTLPTSHGPLPATEWPGSGPPIVLVHGLGGSSIEWSRVAPALAAATGSAVLALDLPGFGRCRLDGRSAAVGHQVRAVGDVLAGLGGATVVGNSMGGLIAVTAAARDAGAVRSLVLVGPALPSGERSARAVAAAARFAAAAMPGIGPRLVHARRRRGPERFTDERLRAIVHRPERVHASVRAALVGLAAEHLADRAWAGAYSEATRSLPKAMGTAWQVLPSITTPTLVVHGRHDRLVPVSLVQRLRGVRPDWTYEVFEDCGHVVHLEAPERFIATLVPWLAATAR
jgi:pimeloyl-ACP methyl ester carboxylesterase